MDVSFNAESMDRLRDQKINEIDTQISNMESRKSNFESQASSLDSQASNCESQASVEASKTITMYDSEGRPYTIPDPAGLAKAAALMQQASQMRQQASALRSAASALGVGISSLGRAKYETTKYINNLKELVQKTDLNAASKLASVAAEIARYNEEMKSILNSFNDKFPLNSANVSGIEAKVILNGAIETIRKEIATATNVNTVVKGTFDSMPENIKADITAQAKGLGKNINDLKPEEIAGLIQIISMDAKYGGVPYNNINQNPSTGAISIEELKYLIKNPSVSFQDKITILLAAGYPAHSVTNIVMGITSIDQIKPQQLNKDVISFFPTDSIAVSILMSQEMSDEYKIKKLRELYNIPKRVSDSDLFTLIESTQPDPFSLSNKINQNNVIGVIQTIKTISEQEILPQNNIYKRPITSEDLYNLYKTHLPKELQFVDNVYVSANVGAGLGISANVDGIETSALYRNGYYEFKWIGDDMYVYEGKDDLSFGVCLFGIEAAGVGVNSGMQKTIWSFNTSRFEVTTPKDPEWELSNGGGVSYGAGGYFIFGGGLEAGYEPQ